MFLEDVFQSKFMNPVGADNNRLPEALKEPDQFPLATLATGCYGSLADSLAQFTSTAALGLLADIRPG